MRRMGWVAVIALFGASAGGATYWTRWYLSEPERTYQRMNDAACRGDVGFFFEHVDAAELKSNIKKATGAEGGTAGKLKRAAVEAAWDEEMESWRSDISDKRWDGAICNWRQTDSGDGYVQVKLPMSGRTRRLYFSRAGGPDWWPTMNLTHMVTSD